MIKLEEFMENKDSVNPILEYRTKKKEPEPEDVVGKDAEDNGTGGLWAIDEPTDEDINTPIDKESLNKNMKILLMKFKAKEDFFVLGEAGWGKTSIIKSLAKKHGRSIITVYLDKAEAVDLGGIPVPMQGKRGGVHQELAMPAWAEYMYERPNKKFLLFFDEMNQAAPDVQNALMPIVLEHEICGRKFGPKGEDGKVKDANFFVGAAGNFEHENDAVSELSGPLKSRFKPIIVWKSGGEEWKNAFKYLHKEWDKELGEKFVNKFEDNAEMFNNPREVEHKIFKLVKNLKEDGDYDYFEPEDYEDRIRGLVKDDLARDQENTIPLLAEYIYNYMQNKSEEDEGGRKKKDQNMLPPNIISKIKQGMKYGYIDQKEDDGKGNIVRVKYGISEENIVEVVIDCYEEEDEPLSPEMIERAIRKHEADGITFKFKKNSEWEKAGYKDPLAD